MRAPARPAIPLPPVGERRMEPDEVLVALAGAPSAAVVGAFARAHGLTLLGSERFELLGETLERFRIPPRQSVRTAVSILRRDARVAFVQPNYRYALAQDSTSTSSPAAGEPPGPRTVSSPPQYALEKLDIARAHGLALGRQVRIAVIDSAIDAANPAFKRSTIEVFDAIGAPQPADRHGTGMVGAIVASSELTGIAPAARILSITAFASRRGSQAQGDTWALLRAMDIAGAQRARIVNMSFAGPPDPLVSRAIEAGQRSGMLFVAAAGNSGPKSPPLYPAADKNVIAVGATDARDNPYSDENRGAYVAVSAPGVDILVPAPGGFDMTTGTSVAAAQVSGVTALLLELRPDLDERAALAALVKSAAGRGPEKRARGVAPGPVDAALALAAVGGSKTPKPANACPCN
jgi:subtilisin family serine protease